MIVIGHPPARGASFVETTLTFLVSVNATYDDCIATVKTPPIHSNTPYNKSANIMVGDCDHGPLIFQVTQDGREYDW